MNNACHAAAAPLFSHSPALFCIVFPSVRMCLHIMGQTRQQTDRGHTLLLHSRITPPPCTPPFSFCHPRHPSPNRGDIPSGSVNQSSQLQLCTRFFDYRRTTCVLKRALWMQNGHHSIQIIIMLKLDVRHEMFYDSKSLVLEDGGPHTVLSDIPP